MRQRTTPDGSTRERLTSTRRSWRKLDLSANADTGEIVAAELTTNDVDDGSQVGPLLDRTAGPVAPFTSDGAYDCSTYFTRKSKVCCAWGWIQLELHARRPWLMIEELVTCLEGCTDLAHHGHLDLRGSRRRHHRRARTRYQARVIGFCSARSFRGSGGHCGASSPVVPTLGLHELGPALVEVSQIVLA